MCGRYVSPDQAAIEREFALVGSRLSNPFKQIFNVTPTTAVPVIWSKDAAPELTQMRWGLIPFFANGLPGAYSTINARVETLRTSPAYRSAWKRGQRCLVVAQGFYEWQTIPGGKQPWYISCADQPVFGFAGVWDASTPVGSEPIRSCTIVTLPASPLMTEIHNTKNREPAIIRREDRETWLWAEPEQAFECLRAYDDSARSAWPVSRNVNWAKNNGPELIEPMQAAS
jgi:putative SOS response-associated peptidase YedK